MSPIWTTHHTDGLSPQRRHQHGFEFDEDSLYPPHEPQFTHEQLSERLVKNLLPS